MVKVGVYDLGRTIGSGTYSTVRLARNMETNEQVVAKIISRATMSSNVDVRREIAILRRVRHENVVRLIEILESPNNYYIILEPVLGGDVCDYIMNHYSDGLPRAECQRLFRQLVSGIGTCHSQGVAHRDLKPDNLLITKDDHQLKIADFGLSRLHRHSKDSAEPHEYAETITGTLAYVAPEMLQGPYDAFKADMWSIGCILYIMCTGRFPFGGSLGPTLESRIISGKIDPLGPRVDADAADIIHKLLCTDPEHRMTLPQLASHPFVACVDEIEQYVQVEEEAPSPIGVRAEQSVEQSMDIPNVHDEDPLSASTSHGPSPTSRRSIAARASMLLAGEDDDD